MKKYISLCLILALGWFCLGALAVTGFHGMSQNCTMLTDAMNPVLKKEDRLLIDKVSPLFCSYQRGDVVLSYPPSIGGAPGVTLDAPHILNRLTGLRCFPYDRAYIRRVVALPGEIVRVGDKKAMKVPAGALFLMADKWTDEVPDYFSLGFVERTRVIGKVVLRWYPQPELITPQLH